MKYFQQTVNFDYSWEEVSTSNWQKYGPWNEKTPHVIAVDTLSRAVDPATGIVSLPAPSFSRVTAFFSASSQHNHTTRLTRPFPLANQC